MKNGYSTSKDFADLHFKMLNQIVKLRMHESESYTKLTSVLEPLYGKPLEQLLQDLNNDQKVTFVCNALGVGLQVPGFDKLLAEIRSEKLNVNHQILQQLDMVHKYCLN